MILWFKPIVEGHSKSTIWTNTYLPPEKITETGEVSESTFYEVEWDDRPDGSPCWQTEDGQWAYYKNNKPHRETGPAARTKYINEFVYSWHINGIDFTREIIKFCKQNDVDELNIPEQDMILFKIKHSGLLDE